MANRPPASEDALNDLHAVVARVLKERILSGEAAAADISNAIKFLKDNGINCPVSHNDDLVILSKELPDFVPADFE
jgi:hypothetical protein